MNDAFRERFPLLQRRLDGKPIVYLDSAATALKPREVLAAERAYHEEFTANVHRGRHALSQEASTAFEAARRRVARHVGLGPDGVVFVKSATEAVNLVARGLKLGPSDVVLASVGEHHSNLVPWMNQAQLAWLEQPPDRPLEPAAVRAALERHRPKVLALSLASNVTGVLHPIAELCQLAREYGALSMVDAAQGAPHRSVRLDELQCDYLAFSGHKLMGPTGIGVLAASPASLARLEPLSLGGGTVEKVTREGFTLKKGVARFEAGTPPISQALGLAAALDVLDALGFEALQAHEASLADALEEGLRGLPSATVLMGPKGHRLAIASIAPHSARLSSDHLALSLSDGFQVMARSGLFCAQPLFDHLKLPQGALRLSAYAYNTRSEIDAACAAVHTLFKRLLG